jgi:hypothetical protein
MLVDRLLGQMVVGDAIMNVGVADQPKPFQCLERAVDRGDVDIRKLAGDVAMDLFRGDRLINARNRLSDQLSLWCHAQALLA